MIWKTLASTLLIVILLLTGASYYLYTKPRTDIQTQINEIPLYTSSMTEVDFEYEEIGKIQKDPIEVDQLHITGWIPDWDIADGLESIDQRPDLFDSISPIWFFINPDGTLIKTTHTNGANQIRFFKDRNIDLIPSIQEFDAENLSEVLNDQNRLNNIIKEIVNETVSNNYAGIDLDIESTLLSDKHLFFELLEKLSDQFKSKNKKLVFTALPKWGDSLFYQGLPQTLRVQDYKRIGELVDEFRIMTYEYSGSRSPKAGPIQPLKWQEKVIQYTINTGIPREKIVLGVATYSYDWTDRPLLERIDLKKATGLDLIDPTLDRGAALFNSGIDKIKANYDYTEEFHEEWGDMVLRYNYQDKDRIVIDPNNRSIEMRKQLAADYGIKGIAYWRIGDETDLEL